MWSCVNLLYCVSSLSSWCWSWFICAGVWEKRVAYGKLSATNHDKRWKILGKRLWQLNMSTDTVTKIQACKHTSRIKPSIKETNSSTRSNKKRYAKTSKLTYVDLQAEVHQNRRGRSRWTVNPYKRTRKITTACIVTYFAWPLPNRKSHIYIEDRNADGHYDTEGTSFTQVTPLLMGNPKYFKTCS